MEQNNCCAEPEYPRCKCSNDDDRTKLNIDDFTAQMESKHFMTTIDQPVFKRGEVKRPLIEEEFSSFNDDGIPPSELDFFSSDFVESDNEEYVPPITRTKHHLIQQLLIHKIHNDDSDCTRVNKTNKRNELLGSYQESLRKKRAERAYHRLIKAKNMECETDDQKAFCLEKMELKDKHLDKPYYYEQTEPNAFKRLLKKRRRAVRRKYEMYALDPSFRCEYEKRCAEEIGSFCGWNFEINAFDDELEPIENLIQGASDSSDEETVSIESFGSSFYDLEIPQSELDFFSSDFEEELDLPYPGPKSNRLNRLRRYLIKCRKDDLDDADMIRTKALKKAEIEGEFRNYVERKRALKKLARLKAASNMNLENMKQKAEVLLDMEIVDKKLHRRYYYDPNEPEIYKILHGKRRRAVQRKYDRYEADEKFRKQIKHTAYVDIIRMRPSPIFEAETDSSGESSLNDTDVPTSEDEFMSDVCLELPANYSKPLTRNKQVLYHELDKYEPDVILDSPSLVNLKRERRLETIQRFKSNLVKRRRIKALNRIRDGTKVSEDPAIQANYLMEQELIDKKLDNGFYYDPREPDIYKEFVEKRKRAIFRKYQAYIKDIAFREDMITRIEVAVLTPKKKQRVCKRKNFNNPFENVVTKRGCRDIEGKQFQRDLKKSGLFKCRKNII